MVLKDEQSAKPGGPDQLNWQVLYNVVYVQPKYWHTYVDIVGLKYPCCWVTARRTKWKINDSSLLVNFVSNPAMLSMLQIAVQW